MARALIRKGHGDPWRDPSNPWYWGVDGDDGRPIDYGTLPTWTAAMRAVEYVFTHRAEFDNPGSP